MQFPLCRHVKTNGIQCKSPSLGTSAYCYFHSNLHHRHRGYRHTDATRNYLIPGQHIELTALEDREAVQVALSVVINALATGNLDTKRAATLLYGLQIASNNAKRLDTQPYAPALTRTIESSPEGLDLAEPGNMLELFEINDEEDMDEDPDNDEEDSSADTTRYISPRSR
jgi:hypothetical protein